MEDDMGAICIHQCLLKLISRAVLTHCRCNTNSFLEFRMSDPEEAFEKKRPTLQRERFLKLYWRSFQIIKSFMKHLFLPGQCSSACVAGAAWPGQKEQNKQK